MYNYHNAYSFHKRAPKSEGHVSSRSLHYRQLYPKPPDYQGWYGPILNRICTSMRNLLYCLRYEDEGSSYHSGLDR
uniref:Uncharacterized protein n=1 Tax=Romanomermis culicivorax TaxID=13658 RepID=A0A915K9I1_ROMCU